MPKKEEQDASNDDKSNGKSNNYSNDGRGRIAGCIFVLLFWDSRKFFMIKASGWRRGVPFPKFRTSEYLEIMIRAYLLRFSNLKLSFNIV